MEIASKLHDGITMERILDDIRDSVQGNLQRQHMTTRQDLHSIMHQYNIDGNAIIVFKQQGSQQGSQTDNIGNDDFLIGIQGHAFQIWLIHYMH